MYVLYILLISRMLHIHYRSTQTHINLLRLNKVYLYMFIVIIYIHKYLYKLQHPPRHVSRRLISMVTRLMLQSQNIFHQHPSFCLNISKNTLLEAFLRHDAII